jgi:hypothetical protein
MLLLCYNNYDFIFHLLKAKAGGSQERTPMLLRMRFHRMIVVALRLCSAHCKASNKNSKTETGSFVVSEIIMNDKSHKKQ